MEKEDDELAADWRRLSQAEVEGARHKEIADLLREGNRRLDAVLVRLDRLDQVRRG